MLEVLVGMGDLQLDGIGSKITIKFSIDGFIRSRIAFLIATITVLDAQRPHSQHATFAFGHARGSENNDIHIDAFISALIPHLEHIVKAGIALKHPKTKKFIQLMIQLLLSADQKALMKMCGVGGPCSTYFCMWYVAILCL